MDLFEIEKSTTAEKNASVFFDQLDSCKLHFMHFCRFLYHTQIQCLIIFLKSLTYRILA